MSSTTETGHAKNTANIQTLISYLENFGERYNPTNGNIQIATFRTLYQQAHENITAIDTANVAYLKAVDDRKQHFDPLSKLLTRVLNAVKSSGADQRMIEEIETLVKKITGRSAAKKSEEEKQALQAKGQSTHEKSTSQMSFDNRLETLNKIIITLKEISQYKPNEPELKIAELIKLYNRIEIINEKVAKYEAPLSTLRIVRNKLLYAPDTGIPDTALAAKAYVKSVFGSSSPEYKQLSKIRFTRYATA